MLSIFLYGLSTVLIIYIVVSVIKERKFKIENAIAVLVFVSSIIVAQQIPPPSWPPIFNRQELIFDEDFNDGVVNGIVASEVAMNIVDLDKSDKALQITNNSGAEWGHYFFEDINISDGGIEYSINITNYNPSLENSSSVVAFHFRSTIEDRRYLLAMLPFQQSLSLNYQGPDAVDGWAPLTKSASAYNLTPNTWHKIKINLKGDNISVYFDDVHLLSADDDRLPSGEIYFGIGANTTVLFDDFRVWVEP